MVVCTHMFSIVCGQSWLGLHTVVVVSACVLAELCECVLCLVARCYISGGGEVD